MKFFHKLHLWLSVPFGIIITLICFSGAMLVFEPEITRILKSEVYYVASSEGEPIDKEELMETVKATLPDSVAITGVTVFDDKDRTYQVNLSKPRRASVFIDQYTGEITGKYERIGFFSTMFRLHRWLLDSANPHGDGIKVGKLLVGISTLIFVIALITGVVIWWPRARKKLGRSLSISFKGGWRGFWKGLHVAGGIYSLILLLAMLLTGLTWSFPWYRTAFYSVCGVEYAPRNLGNPENGRKADGKRGEYKGEGTGEIPSVIKSAGPVQADKLRGWIYSIHTGGFGGIPIKIIWFLGALLGASLPLTGYYIWIRHLIRGHNKPSPV